MSYSDQRQSESSGNRRPSLLAHVERRIGRRLSLVSTFEIGEAGGRVVPDEGAHRWRSACNQGVITFEAGDGKLAGASYRRPSSRYT